MNELLGFAVLSGPLFLILLWLPAAIWIAFKISKRFTQPGKKVAAGIGVFILTFLLPFADEIAGTIYFNHLCTTQAGVKVYKTVELPAEYWDERGRAMFFNQQGYIDRDFWAKKINESGGRMERYSSVFGIDKDNSTVVDKEKGDLLGEIITFRHWGGWLRRNFSPENTADSCQFIHDQNFSRNFYGRLFKPSHSFK